MHKKISVTRHDKKFISRRRRTLDERGATFCRISSIAFRGTMSTQYASSSATLVEIRPGRSISVYDSFSETPDALPEKTVFFFHGSMAHMDQYDAQIKEFRSETTRVIAYDALGCGSSSKPRDYDAYATEELLEDAKTVFSVYGSRGKTNVLVGHSYGTTVVTSVSHDVQSRVSAIVLLGGGTMADGGPGIFYLPEFFLRWIQPLLSKGFLERAFHSETLEKRTPSHKKLIDETVKRSGSNEMHVVVPFYRGMKWTPTSKLENTNVPALWLHGEADGFFSVAQATETADKMPRSKVVVVERAGHQLMQERPEEVNRLVREWIETHFAE